MIDTIARERSPDHPLYKPNPTPFIWPDGNRPWLPAVRYECQYRVCERCRPDAPEKSWLSLDAVLKGDISPTLATGYSFSFERARPLADPHVVRNLGCRPAPLVRIP